MNVSGGINGLVFVAPLLELLAAGSAVAAQDDGQRTFRDLRIGESAGALWTDFCRLSLVVSRPAGDASRVDPNVIVVKRREDGVSVVINPPPSVGDTDAAVSLLNRFLSDATWLKCKPMEEVWKVQSVTVRGLDVIQRDGQPDFEFKGGVAP